VNRQRDSSEHRHPPGVDDCKRAGSKSDDQTSCPRIQANVVGIVTQIDPAGRREIGRMEEPDGAIAPTGDGKEIDARDKGNALLLLESSEPADHAAGREVDDIDGVIAELGHRQMAAPEINRHVIDAAGYIGE
jgi:hypothetical protein